MRYLIAANKHFALIYEHETCGGKNDTVFLYYWHSDIKSYEWGKIVISLDYFVIAR
jgi:hypothetical protein